MPPPLCCAKAASARNVDAAASSSSSSVAALVVAVAGGGAVPATAGGWPSWLAGSGLPIMSSCSNSARSVLYAWLACCSRFLASSRSSSSSAMRSSLRLR